MHVASVLMSAYYLCFSKRASYAVALQPHVLKCPAFLLRLLLGSLQLAQAPLETAIAHR